MKKKKNKEKTDNKCYETAIIILVLIIAGLLIYIVCKRRQNEIDVGGKEKNNDRVVYTSMSDFPALDDQLRYDVVSGDYIKADYLEQTTFEELCKNTNGTNCERKVDSKGNAVLDETMSFNFKNTNYTVKCAQKSTVGSSMYCSKYIVSIGDTIIYTDDTGIDIIDDYLITSYQQSDGTKYILNFSGTILKKIDHLITWYKDSKTGENTILNGNYSVAIKDRMLYYLVYNDEKKDSATLKSLDLTDSKLSEKSLESFQLGK